MRFNADLVVIKLDLMVYECDDVYDMRLCLKMEDLQWIAAKWSFNII